MFLSYAIILFWGTLVKWEFGLLSVSFLQNYVKTKKAWKVCLCHLSAVFTFVNSL